jgi:hypothetical protein
VLDERGVGLLITNAKNMIRSSNAHIQLGVQSNGHLACDINSIRFYESIGLDYIVTNWETLVEAKISVSQAFLIAQNIVSPNSNPGSRNVSNA